jgi:hypothetical protein
VSRRGVAGVVGVVLALALAGCGVTPQRKPEPLPATAVPITPPTVTQEIMPDPPGRPLMFPAVMRLTP